MRFRLSELAARFRALSGLQMGVAAFGATVLLVFGGFGTYRTYDYVQHDNDFCVSCHLMQDPFDRFEASKHAGLSCKACHKPSNIERTKMALTQLVEWPENIETHARVSNEKCEHCHVEGDPEQWKQIGQTAGHRRHLESRDPALAEMECVTCHSVSVHEFAPTDAVCGSFGCHEDVKVRLGGMREREVHCVVCHDFTRAVPRGARSVGVDRDGHLLIPQEDQCLQCHDMQVLVSIAPGNEPHGAVCGTCHDAHSQKAGPDALRSCTSSGCHENPASSSNSHHRWPSIELAVCTNCHIAHEFKVEEDDCTRCHADIFRGRGSASESPPAESGDWNDPIGGREPGYDPLASLPYGDFVPMSGPWVPPSPADFRAPTTAYASVAQQQDPFDHNRHRTVACRRCHTSEQALAGSGPAWCESCHHGDRNPARCARCHSSELLTVRTIPFAFNLPGGPSQRTLTFQHTPHQSLDCAGCHGTPPRRAVQTTCGDCHAEHHGGQTACTSCHSKPPEWAHEPAVVHVSCGDGGAVCHARVAEGVVPERRAVCLACHPEFPREGPLPPLPRVDTTRGNPVPLEGRFLRSPE